jgi:hypothetical protein
MAKDLTVWTTGETVPGGVGEIIRFFGFASE